MYCVILTDVYEYYCGAIVWGILEVCEESIGNQ